MFARETSSAPATDGRLPRRSGAGSVVNGAIDWTENSLDCDYSVAGSQAGSSYSLRVFCDLDYTATTLEGRPHTQGSIQVDASGQMSMSTWDTRMTFNEVVYVNGQPSGGSIDISAAVTVLGETFTADESVSF